MRDNKYRLESLVNAEGVCMMQLKGPDGVAGFASFRIDIAKEFLGFMLILKDKLNNAGLIAIEDIDLMPVPQEATAWS